MDDNDHHGEAVAKLIFAAAELANGDAELGFDYLVVATATLAKVQSRPFQHITLSAAAHQDFIDEGAATIAAKIEELKS